MSLQLYNTLTREKETFEPLVPGRVHLYVCGPTVQDHAHIGHAKLYVAIDVVVRYLRFSGYKVRYVQNITDVGHLLDTGEDRILKGAARERIEPMEVAEKYTRIYFDGMDRLGVLRPDISPRASGHVIEQIEMIKTLIAKGHAYESNGSVYFDVSTWPGYGKLSGRTLEEQEAGARVEVREEKRHPGDFALWKKAPPEHILRWPSPWGEGYPGWHVECSAMARKYLGQTFDIHGGGLENIFPHNECEVAQSEAAHGAPFARYWLHVGSLTIDGVKMSKSLGNFITIADALKRWKPEQIRLFILGNHYRSPLDFSDQALAAAGEGARRLADLMRRLQVAQRTAPAGPVDPAWSEALTAARAGFIAAMDDDFSTPAAIASLFALSREVNKLLDEGETTLDTLKAIETHYQELAGGVLNILPFGGSEGGSGGPELAPFLDLLVQLRAELRKNKQYALADQIRQAMAEHGVILEDGPQGTIWKLA